WRLRNPIKRREKCHLSRRRIRIRRCKVLLVVQEIDLDLGSAFRELLVIESANQDRSRETCLRPLKRKGLAARNFRGGRFTFRLRLDYRLAPLNRRCCFLSCLCSRRRSFCRCRGPARQGRLFLLGRLWRRSCRRRLGCRRDRERYRLLPTAPNHVVPSRNTDV